jgi:tRNA G18 (ribose-2'-O)-methylase SpoU
MQMRIAVLLHNVRSTHNVGAIFRTADGAGAEKMFLTGYTPRPLDRFGREDKKLVKTALGAERMLPWEHQTSPIAALKKLKREGWWVVGVEQDERAKDYHSFKLAKPTVFVFGNEVRGLSSELRRACDQLVEIPMRGGKESLNVAVAAGIILFSATR